MDLLLVDIPNSSLRTISVTLTLPADLNEFSEVAAAIVFVIIRRYSYVFHMGELFSVSFPTIKHGWSSGRLNRENYNRHLERREIRIVACPHFGVM